jgi:putative peptide zinc metalloprotease protein
MREMTAMMRTWPRLREDLTLHVGPPDRDGAPTWTVHDPARNQYFALDWIAFEVIARLSLGSVDAVCERVNAETTLHLEPDDVDTVLQFLDQNELVSRPDQEGIAQLARKQAATQTGWLQKVLHGYLFFRIPLWRPDAWLERMLPRLAFFFTSYFFKLSALVGAIGMWGVFRQWETFQATLVDTFSLDGLMGYAGALVLVKLLHELGHALMAKRCGCRVPTMGLAFLVMWPVAYTDVTESWKLNSHRQRLQIAGAGMVTELLMACWMLLLWVLLPTGHLREASFFLATTSLVATLAINASPLMRFDGYFLLCDMLGQPNLHARSFAHARWWLREKLFRLEDDPPEALSLGWHRFFIAFALMTWIYRLGVFLGIALLVYHYFFKALGLVLFGIEIWFFVFRHIWTEIKVWQQRWPDIAATVRHRPAFYLSLLAVGILVLPLDVTVNAQGMLKPERSLHVVAHQASQMDTPPPPVGTIVAAGSLVMAMHSPELQEKTQKAGIKIGVLERQFSSAGFSDDTTKQQAILKEQLDSAREELKGLQAESMRLRPVAPFQGVVADVEPNLLAGQWVPKGMSLVRLIDDQRWIVDTYVDEFDLRRLQVGHWAWFVSEAAGLPDVRLKVMSIEKDAIQTLSDPALATTAGGQIMVRVNGNKLYPEHALYRVRLEAVSLHEKLSTGHLRGRVVILGWPKSMVGELVRNALATLLREAGF